MKTKEFFKNNSSILIAVLSTIVVIFVVLVIWGLQIEKNDKKQAELVRQQEITSKLKSNSDFKLSFIEGCTENEVLTYIQCSCMYDFISRKYGMDGLMDMAKEYTQTGTISDYYMDGVMEACFY